MNFKEYLQEVSDRKRLKQKVTRFNSVSRKKQSRSDAKLIAKELGLMDKDAYNLYNVILNRPYLSDGYLYVWPLIQFSNKNDNIADKYIDIIEEYFDELPDIYRDISSAFKKTAPHTSSEFLKASKDISKITQPKLVVGHDSLEEFKDGALEINGQIDDLLSAVIKSKSFFSEKSVLKALENELKQTKSKLASEYKKIAAKYKDN